MSFKINAYNLCLFSVLDLGSNNIDILYKFYEKINKKIIIFI